VNFYFVKILSEAVSAEGGKEVDMSVTIYQPTKAEKFDQDLSHVMYMLILVDAIAAFLIVYLFI